MRKFQFTKISINNKFSDYLLAGSGDDISELINRPEQQR